MKYSLLTNAIALEQCTLDDLVQVDSTYLTRIGIRRGLHDTQGKYVMQCNPVAIDATNELYEWMLRTYLPKRFPTMYQLRQRDVLSNLVTGEEIEIHGTDVDQVTKLKQLSSHVDCDFLFLLPESDPNAPSPPYPGPAFHPSSYSSSSGTSTPKDRLPTSEASQPKYHLHGVCGTFPSGFNWLQKIGQPLAGIHTPVPGYGAKLERSMDRFFATLPPARIVQRRNWAITMNRELFILGTNHGDASETGGSKLADSLAEQIALQKSDIQSSESDAKIDSDVDLEKVVLRTERQTLHRLPKTGALVFGFKTYQYNLDDVKKEGSGEALARAIEGLWLGNVKRMVLYKKANVWGKTVVDYLRS